MTTTPILDKAGLSAAFGAFVLWGVFPLFFKAMASLGASPLEIVGWRVVWSLPFALVLVVLAGRWGAATQIVRRPKLLAVLALSACLIAVNWSVYIWAVSSGRTIAASLGYFLNPLISLAGGALFFRERVSPAGWLGVALAGIGVAIETVALHALPWVPLVLAVSFAFYGIVRKGAPVEASTGLLIECAVLFIPALIMVLRLQQGGHSHFGHNAVLTLFLIVAGPATVVPLAAFAFAARRLPLSVVGVLQFISPTLQFLCGIFEGERVGPMSIVAFAFIWSGVAVFLYGVLRRPAPLTQAPALRA